jgi:hypothetical protein
MNSVTSFIPVRCMLKCTCKVLVHGLNSTTLGMVFPMRYTFGRFNNLFVVQRRAQDGPNPDMNELVLDIAKRYICTKTGVAAA